MSKRTWIILFLILTVVETAVVFVGVYVYGINGMIAGLTYAAHRWSIPVALPMAKIGSKIGEF